VFADLHTPRLHLRPLVPADERLYCGLYTDPAVMRHVADPLTPGAALRAFGAVLKQVSADPPQARYWILCPRDGGGGLGLMRKLGFAPMDDADATPAPRRWQLERQAWLDGSAPAFASPPGNC
jgi:RimJ/RimL family protein N-acetyltransferase